MTELNLQSELEQSTTPEADPLRYWKIAILAALFVFLFRNELIRLVETWKMPDESHGVLIPAFSLYFLWQDRAALKQIKAKFGIFNFAGIVLIAIGVIGYSLCLTRRFGSPRPYMMLPVIAGMTLLAGGWGVFKRVWLPIVFLVFAFQLPPTIHDRITTPLRMWSSVLATVVLNFFPGIVCEASGVVISGTHHGIPFDLNVADACSGMRLLRTFVALGVAMAWLEKRPASHRIVLLLSTVPIAIICNMLRVLLTGMIHIYIGAQYAEGMLHTMLGLVMLGLAFVMYGGLAWIMNNLFYEESSKEKSTEGDQDIITLNPAKNPAGKK